jgi:hypothetical protein
MTSFAMNHHYVTGEWWNAPHRYWEYCMFDWQNRYNHPWRIRPVYVFNVRTSRLQHIEGGMQHWLFDKSVLTDLYESIKKRYLWFLFFVVFYYILVRILFAKYSVFF